MTVNQIQSQIDFIKNQLVSKYKPQKIILFGSYAYGQPYEDSDVDLLVIADTNESFHDRISEMRPFLPKDRSIDLIVLTPTEYKKTKSSNPLILEIETKGRVIYG